MVQPFADKYRPEVLKDIVGQKHIIGEGKIINKLLSSGAIPNMILYGPPGTGKTTLAMIIAKELKMPCVQLNAVDIGVKEIRQAMQKNPKGFVMYIDEFHMLNKKQQQELLEATEHGLVILVASTTENPYFSIYKAILSRSTIFQFEQVDKEDIINNLKTVISKVETDFSVKINGEDFIEYIADISGGDARSSINIFEMAFRFKYNEGDKEVNISIDDVKKSNTSRAYDWDNDGDSKYDTLSAFHKSMRGSDANAAIYYLARLIKGGDIQGICRRILCCASEDVGMADSNAIIVAQSCVEAALKVGFPEARLHLAHAVIYIANAPKSNSVCIAIDQALSDVETKYASAIPPYLKDAHYAGAAKLRPDAHYKYPHDYPGHWVDQQYLPESLKSRQYYIPQENEEEQKAKARLDNLKR